MKPLCVVSTFFPLPVQQPKFRPSSQHLYHHNGLQTDVPCPARPTTPAFYLPTLQRDPPSPQICCAMGSFSGLHSVLRNALPPYLSMWNSPSPDSTYSACSHPGHPFPLPLQNHCSYSLLSSNAMKSLAFRSLFYLACLPPSCRIPTHLSSSSSNPTYVKKLTKSFFH